MKLLTPWPSSKLTATCKSSPAVYLALVALAYERGSAQIRCTRETLSKLSGIKNRKTISLALAALSAGGWVVLRYGRAGAKSWLRITLPVYRQTGHRNTVSPLPCVPKIGSQERTRPAQETGHRNNLPAYRKKGHTLLRESGGKLKNSPPPARGASESDTATPDDTTTTVQITDILAEIALNGS